MSRKKVDLRLKKRSDSSVCEDATSSGVHISTENSDFKRVGLLSEKTRLLLHRLLVGETPQTFSPLPPSQLIQSSPAAGLPKPSECRKSTEEDDRDEFKWTPLPPPNVDALISQMPLVPMSMEQLCAPIDEGEENECLERLAVHGIDGNMEKPSLVVAATADVETVTLERKAVKSKYPDPSLAACSHQNNDLADAKSSAGSIAPVIKASSNASVRKESLVRGKSISQFIHQSKKNDKHLHAVQKSLGSSHDQGCQDKVSNLKSMNTGKSSRPPKPRTLQSNFVNLTDSSEPVQHQRPKKAPNYDRSSASGFKNTAQNQRQNPDSTSSTRSSISGSEPRRSSTHHREPFEEEEFDKLCVDIDLDTIGDFSGPVSDPGPSHRTPTTADAPSSKPQHATAHSSSMVKHGTCKYQQSTESSSVKVKGDGTTKQRFLKGKASVRSELQLTRNASGAHGHSRLNSPTPLPASNVSSTTRFLGAAGKTAAAPVPQRSKFAYPTSAATQRKTTGVKRRDAPPDVSARTKHPRLETDARPRHSNETTSSSSCSSTGGSGGSRATSTESFQSVDTRTAHRTTAQNVHASSGTAARGTTLSSHASRGATNSAMCSTASGSTSQQMSRLSTENCPMCNTRFPTWYQQVDADQHIAQCLQAVMDLEVENELELL